MHTTFAAILAAHGAPKPIVTEFVNPPIPVRNCDWSAVFEDYDPESNDPVGWGATEAEAIADLMIELESREDEP